MLSSSITNSLHSAVSGFYKFGGNRLPPGEIARWVYMESVAAVYWLDINGDPVLDINGDTIEVLGGFEGGWIDIVGLSVSDYLSVSSNLRSVIYADAETMRSAEDIITNIEASAYLDQYCLMETSVGDYVLYPDGIDINILKKARKYCKLPVWPDPPILCVWPISGGATGDGAIKTPFLYWPNAPTAGQSLKQLNSFETTGNSRTINLTAANVVIDGLRSGGSTQADFWAGGGADGLILKNAILRQGSGTYSVVLFGASSADRVTNALLSNINLTPSGTANYALYLRLVNALTVLGVELHNWTVSAGSKVLYLYDATGENNLSDISVSNHVGYGLWAEICATLNVSNFTAIGLTLEALYFKTITSLTLDNISITTCRGLALTDVAAFIINDLSVNALTFGIAIVNSDGTIQNSQITNCPGNGITPTSGASIICKNVTVDTTLGDAFSTPTEASNLGTKYTAIGCTAINCGALATSDSGDGFTVHALCTADVLYSFASHNLKSGLAVTESSAGTCYNNTFIDNLGGSAAATIQAGMWFNATGLWTVKNNLVVQRGGYCCIITTTALCPVLDYNIYLSDSLTPFSVGVTGDLTFTQYIVAGIAKGGDPGFEAHSAFIYEHNGQWDVYLASAPTVINRTLNYCPVSDAGHLVAGAGNPAIGTAVRIDGVTDQSYIDPWGYISSNNIGADQTQ